MHHRIQCLAQSRYSINVEEREGGRKYYRSKSKLVEFGSLLHGKKLERRERNQEDEDMGHQESYCLVDEGYVCEYLSSVYTVCSFNKWGSVPIIFLFWSLYSLPPLELQGRKRFNHICTFCIHIWENLLKCFFNKIQENAPSQSISQEKTTPLVSRWIIHVLVFWSYKSLMLFYWNLSHRILSGSIM